MRHKRWGCSVGDAFPWDNSRREAALSLALIYWLAYIYPSNLLHFPPSYTSIPQKPWKNGFLCHYFDFLKLEFLFLSIPAFISLSIYVSFGASYCILFAKYTGILFWFLGGYIFLHFMGLPDRFTLKCRIFLWITELVSLKVLWMFFPSPCSSVFHFLLTLN